MRTWPRGWMQVKRHQQHPTILFLLQMVGDSAASWASTKPPTNQPAADSPDLPAPHDMPLAASLTCSAVSRRSSPARMVRISFLACVCTVCRSAILGTAAQRLPVPVLPVLPPCAHCPLLFCKGAVLAVFAGSCGGVQGDEGHTECVAGRAAKFSLGCTRCAGRPKRQRDVLSMDHLITRTVAVMNKMSRWWQGAVQLRRWALPPGGASAAPACCSTCCIRHRFTIAPDLHTCWPSHGAASTPTLHAAVPSGLLHPTLPSPTPSPWLPPTLWRRQRS